MTITAEQLRDLLAADPDAQLVVHEGRAAVLAPEAAAAPEYAGALAVLSNAELRSRLDNGHEPSDELLHEIALRLETAVDSMGG